MKQNGTAKRAKKEKTPNDCSMDVSVRDHESLIREIIGGFFEVYNRLGYGFREHIYSLALERELARRGLHVAREVQVPIYYRGEFLANERADLLVEDRVV